MIEDELNVLIQKIEILSWSLDGLWNADSLQVINTRLKDWCCNILWNLDVFGDLSVFVTSSFLSLYSYVYYWFAQFSSNQSRIWNVFPSLLSTWTGYTRIKAVWMEHQLTKDCESEDHVLHYLVTETATWIIRSVHDWLHVVLTYPDLHLLLHFVGTKSC